MIRLNSPVSEKITSLAALGLLAGMALSWPLWNTDARECFPVVALWGGPNWKSPAVLLYTGIWPALAVSVIAAVTLLFPGKRGLTVSLAAVLLFLGLSDINRLQPWVWFYLLLFIAGFIGKKESVKVESMRWVLAGVYFWGGFNKLTPYFVEDNFPWFCEAFPIIKNLGQYPLAGYVVAAMEMSLAAGILLPKWRPYFRRVIPVFHATIVIFLWKLDWNMVVIPWNVAMAGMAWLLCSAQASPKEMVDTAVLPRKPLLMPGIAGWLACFSPLLHLFGLWPHPLSWQMYTNTQPEATFVSEYGQTCNRELDEMWNTLAFDNKTKLSLDDWATQELHVPVFADIWVFRRIKTSLYGCPLNGDLYILTVDQWDKSKEKLEKISK